MDHLLTATVLRRRYEDDLRRGLNRFRWLEYSISSTIMVLLICAYTGITGLSALIGIAGANIGSAEPCASALAVAWRGWSRCGAAGVEVW